MRRRTMLSAVAGAVVATAFAGGIAWATTSGELQACAKKDNGQLRLVATAGDCGPSETAVSWNEQGPQGPSGPSGPVGAKGDKGDKGEPGNLALAGQSCEAGESVTGFDADGDILCTGGSPPPPPPPPPAPSQWTLVPQSNSVSFGNTPIGLASDVAMTMLNTTAVTATTPQVIITGQNFGEFAIVSGCGAPVPPGGSCGLTFRFRPSAVGVRTAEAVVVTPLANYVLPLQGVGV